MANDINTLSAGATVTGAEVTKDGDLMVSIRDDSTGLQTPIYAGKIDVSDVVVDKLKNYAPISATIRPTIIGNPAICEDSAAWGLQGLKVYGKSTQDGEPSPENPVPIVSAGDDGNVAVNFYGENRINYFLAKDYGTTRNCNISLDGNVFAFTAMTDGDSYFGGHISTKSGESYPERSKQLLFPVTPGEKLKIVASNSYFKTSVFCFVKKDYTVISFSGAFSITVPENAAYATARLGNASAKASDGTQYTTFMVCREEYTGDFVPYQGTQTLTVSTPNGLSGIPVTSGGNFTDAEGQQWICDAKDYRTGKQLQRIYKLVVDHNTSIYTASQNDLLTFAVNCPQRAQKDTSFSSKQGVCQIKSMCDYYEQSLTGLVGYDKNNAFGFYNTDYQTTTLFINDRRFSSVEDYKAWLKSNPVTFLYSLETPIKTDISAEELAVYRALTTYEGTTVISTTEPVTGIEASYVMDGNKYKDSVDKRLSALEAAQTGV